MFRLYYNSDITGQRMLGYALSLPGIFVTEFLVQSLKPNDNRNYSNAGEKLYAQDANGVEYVVQDDYTWTFVLADT